MSRIPQQLPTILAVLGWVGLSGAGLIVGGGQGGLMLGVASNIVVGYGYWQVRTRRRNGNGNGGGMLEHTHLRLETPLLSTEDEADHA